MINYDVKINGLDINATYTKENVQEIFIPLLKRLAELQREKGRRILVMLAAPPGAGKSTLLSFWENLSKEFEAVPEIQTIGMDGFHRRQEYLTSHFAIRDGKEIRMVDIKGAPETFDLELLKDRVKRVAAGENCGWPVYDRTLHNPIDNAITITSDIVILEGNYLLLQERGWDELSSYADYTISIVADKNLLRDRLINRKAQSGNSINDATAFVDYSDMVNVETCLQKTKRADLILEVKGDEYIIK